MTQQIRTVTLDEALMKEIWFAMGYADATPDQTIRETAARIAERLIPTVRIRYMYDIVPAAKLSPTGIMLGGRIFKPGGIICSYLKGMSDACVFVATAGAEFNAAVQELKAEGDILADFIADAIGSALADHAVALLEKDLAGSGTVVSMPYSPGYCGWDIREQQIFFSLFPPQPCGIKLTESSLMYPEKSVSGFFAMGKELIRQPYHCEICHNTKCYKRRNEKQSR